MSVATADLPHAILDAARALVAQNGYADLSMRKVARSVGCSPGTIYLYYENKDALYAALIDEAVGLLIDAYGPAFEIRDPVERLEAFCRSYIGFALGYPELYKTMYLELRVDPGAVSPDGYRRARKPLQDTADALEEAHAQGLLHAPSPIEGATVVWASLHGMLSLLLARQVDPRADRDRLLDLTVAHVVAGFRCLPSQADA